METVCAILLTLFVVLVLTFALFMVGCIVEDIVEKIQYKQSTNCASFIQERNKRIVEIALEKLNKE